MNFYRTTLFTFLRKTVRPGAETEDLRAIDFGALADVVRAGFIVKTPGQATRIITALGKKYEVMDEGWKKTPEGYFDRKALIKMPNGSLAEFQLWPTEMYNAKMNQGGHQLYAKWRG